MFHYNQHEVQTRWLTTIVLHNICNSPITPWSQIPTAAGPAQGFPLHGLLIILFHERGYSPSPLHVISYRTLAASSRLQPQPKTILQDLKDFETLVRKTENL